MLQLSEPYITGNAWRYVKDCLDSGWVAGSGKYVDKFERQLSKYIGVKVPCCVCANGTAGLHISLLLSNIEPQQEVIVPTVTFISTINAARYINAIPVFMDCDEYLNLDVEKLSEFLHRECIMTPYGLQNKKSKRIIKAIIPVHIFGALCDMGTIIKLAQKFNLKVIEDAAESLGSHFLTNIKNKHIRGKYAGTIGDMGVFSFNGNKILTTGGGGAIVSNSVDTITKARYLINQAKDDNLKYIHNEIGYNYRISNIQAALGLAQLEHIEKFIATKKKNYFIYKNELTSIDGLKILDYPPNTRPNYWYYTLLVDETKFGISRDKLMYKLLIEHNIQTRPLWYLNHLQKPYKNYQSYKIEKALKYYPMALNLPCSSFLNQEDIMKVVKSIKKIRAKYATRKYK